MNTPYVEQDCTIEFQGRKFESGGAFVSPDYAIGYLKFDHEYLYATGEVTTWHGEHLGNCQNCVKVAREFLHRFIYDASRMLY